MTMTQTQSSAASTAAEAYTTQVMYVCEIPTIKGQNVTHPTRESAEREAKNAAKIGHAASVIEVLVAMSQRTRVAVSF